MGIWTISFKECPIYLDLLSFCFSLSSLIRYLTWSRIRGQNEIDNDHSRVNFGNWKQNASQQNFQNPAEFSRVLDFLGESGGIDWFIFFENPNFSPQKSTYRVLVEISENDLDSFLARSRSMFSR